MELPQNYLKLKLEEVMVWLRTEREVFKNADT
jgi:hypothetical protein